MTAKGKDVNLEKEKLEIIRWVASLKDDTAIERLKMLKQKQKTDDWWGEITEEEKLSIDKGLADAKAGRVKPHKEAKKLYERWL